MVAELFLLILSYLLGFGDEAIFPTLKLARRLCSSLSFFVIKVTIVVEEGVDLILNIALKASTPHTVMFIHHGIQLGNQRCNVDLFYPRLRLGLDLTTY